MKMKQSEVFAVSVNEPAEQRFHSIYDSAEVAEIVANALGNASVEKHVIIRHPPLKRRKKSTSRERESHG